jgi:hypothetical protein
MYHMEKQPEIHSDDAVVEDIIEVIPAKETEHAGTETGSDCDFDPEDEYVHEDDYDMERVIDALGSIFVSSEAGDTITDVLVQISSTLKKHEEIMSAHVEAIDKQNKVLFRLAKVIEAQK